MQMEAFVTEKIGADEFERVVEYDMKIITAISKIESSIKKLTVTMHDRPPSMGVTENEQTMSQN